MRVWCGGVWVGGWLDIVRLCVCVTECCLPVALTTAANFSSMRFKIKLACQHQVLWGVEMVSESKNKRERECGCECVALTTAPMRNFSPMDFETKLVWLL